MFICGHGILWLKEIYKNKATTCEKSTKLFRYCSQSQGNTLSMPNIICAMQ